MKVTFLLSAYDRPHLLWGSLGSLIAQSDPDWECIVLANHPEWGLFSQHRRVVLNISDPRISIVHSFNNEDPAWDCYWSVEAAVKQIDFKGEWLCFPSDDSYYCPEFVERMTDAGRNADAVYCDILYDRRIGGKRSVLVTAAHNCAIDKISFTVRREKFIGFPDKPRGAPGPSICDGLAVDRMVAMGYRFHKVEECLCVHN